MKNNMIRASSFVYILYEAFITQFHVFTPNKLSTVTRYTHLLPQPSQEY